MADPDNTFDLGDLGNQVNDLEKSLGDLNDKTFATLKKRLEVVSDLLNEMQTKIGKTAAIDGLNKKLEEATQKLAQFSSSAGSGTVLGAIAKDAAQTNDNIGDLLKKTKEIAETEKDTADTIGQIQQQNKKAAENAAETAREGKEESKSSVEAIAARLTSQQKQSMSSMSKIYSNATSPLFSGLVNMLGLGTKGAAGAGVAATGGVAKTGLLGGIPGFGGATGGIVGGTIASISGFLLGFIPPVIKAYQTLFRGLYNAISPIFKLLGNGVKAIYTTFMETFPLANELKDIVLYIGESFGILGKMLFGAMKSIGGVIDYGLVMLRSVFGTSIPRLKTILTFFGDIFTGIGSSFSKLGKFFSGDGILFGTMSAIEKLFGYGAITPFVKAFEFAGKLASRLPLLAVIPTAIETVVFAFKKFQTEGFRGAFKAIMVGLIKGILAFFSLGLSDFALDFEKMYSTLGDSLGGLIDQIGGFVMLFVDIFNWMIGIVVQVWEGILKPIFMSLWEDALKPVLDALSAVGDFAMILLDIIITVAKPIIAITRFIYKIMFEVVKLIWDFLIYPILWLLVPVFKLLFKAIGILMTPVKLLFQVLTFLIGGLWNNFLKPIVNWITDLFTAGAEMGSLSDFIKDALAYWWGIIKEGWDFIIGYYEMLTDTIANAMLWWWELITDTWDYVYGLWDKLTDMLAYGLLWWWDATMAAWDYVVGLWEDLTDALAYGILWWQEKITAAWDYVFRLWKFAVDALAESLEPIISPIMEFFDYVGDIFQQLMDYASSLVDWIPFVGGDDEETETAAEAEAKAQKQYDNIKSAMPFMGSDKETETTAETQASPPQQLTERQKMMRSQREDNRKFQEAMNAAEQEDPGLRERLRQEMSTGGAAGGAGISAARAPSPPPVVFTNAPTTNVSTGGGGGIPVPLAPNPVRHADPTRALIST